ncbi:MAG: MBL fold metallo-hydrolase [Ignavibacteriae bacterium]|nr:MBL fold metallo-hydrolase [Ignavibacteriota bacterium]MCB9206597.1 MBL fold metallo-hydrolase [Ignavibacteriales bacterium]MCB9209685.1 MBL fold metallo-hydrolase [Ignavibacteriales bacterium]MCB9218841.1 MBL fold metallo-hydrolase [Ignavibacteriales bacterium]
MIEIKKFTFNPFQENTYVVWEKDSKETLIIDPGCSNSNEQNILNNYISENELNIKYLLNSHCHIDHILGNKYIKEKYVCKFFAPELDIPLLNNLTQQAQMFGISADESPQPDEFITEELELEIGSLKINFIFTPGHTPGEYCILINDEKICISGDVLFLEGIGRTDLWGGDYNTLIKSIKTKLFTLNEDYKVFPGHGDETTIGYEKLNNPFLT